jgi:HlyD family secretion protein
MTRGRKISLIIGGVAALAIGASVTVYEVRKGIVSVEAAPVVRTNLTSIVSATGEIRPKNYTNVLAQNFGRITDIYVHEGEKVRKGDILLKVESVQPAANVSAQQATIAGAKAGVSAAEANFQASEAVVAQRQADLGNASFDWKQSQQLFEAGLISRQSYEASKATYNSARAALAAAQAQLAQARAQQSQATDELHQAQAVLVGTENVLQLTTYRAPIAGMVTYIAVRVGENVVPGIQNAEGAYLMTISDMSVVTAEVRVDETDIINVHDGQLAHVQIDALPGQSFTGHVTGVGTQAIIRSTGLSTTQTTAGDAEAKDFKVVVTLDHPPSGLRPGLTATATIRTAYADGVLAIPIQALVTRSRQVLQQQSEAGAGQGVEAAALPTNAPANGPDPQDVQGVFVIRDGLAVFVPVQTGIMGITDIAVSHGLRQGDEIIVGSYQVLRTLQSGTKVQVEKTPSATS